MCHIAAFSANTIPIDPNSQTAQIPYYTILIYHSSHLSHARFEWSELAKTCFLAPFVSTPAGSLIRN